LLQRVEVFEHGTLRDTGFLGNLDHAHTLALPESIDDLERRKQ
jgi:hypothetical protein